MRQNIYGIQGDLSRMTVQKCARRNDAQIWRIILRQNKFETHMKDVLNLTL